ncbi:30S ribosomal protein S17e [Candidatus Woesearchaeota archaeon]|nr:30S ribosomal protein S17e [Candidatus Woesearchaeota archaeon]
MGRIKTTPIKRKTKELYNKYGDKFTGDFEQNKKIIPQYADIASKKIKNIITGYITRLKRKE